MFSKQEAQLRWANSKGTALINGQEILNMRRLIIEASREWKRAKIISHFLSHIVRKSSQQMIPPYDFSYENLHKNLAFLIGYEVTLEEVLSIAKKNDSLESNIKYYSKKHHQMIKHESKTL